MRNRGLLGISLDATLRKLGSYQTLTSIFIAGFACSSSPRQGWSRTSVIITNPLLSILENCRSMQDLKQIQARMVISGMIEHKFPASRLLAFCALSDSGDLIYACRIFSQISNPNAFMWNVMIRCFHWRRSSAEAINLFRGMLRKDADVDNRTFVFVLKACESLSHGESIHCLIGKLGFDLGLLVRNALMHFYLRFRFLSSAKNLFFWSTERDVVSWTTMVDGHAQLGRPLEALAFFRDMVSTKGTDPNEITLISVLSSCSKTKLLNLGKSVHGFALRNGMNLSTNLLNALIDMYGKSGSIETARSIFTAMGKNKDVFSYTSLINALAKSGNLELARQLFDETPVKNDVSWSAMIAGYAQSNQPDAALDLFSEMQSSGVDPIEATLVSVLSACAQSGRLDAGRRARRLVQFKQLQLTTSLGNAFIHMYAKCGAINEAVELFSAMEERDLVTWNSIILGHAIHGRSEDALILFERMKVSGERPDEVTFVGVLAACGHGGLTREGIRHFSELEAVFSLRPSPEHYACMVGLLARAGLLEEAVGVIDAMPEASEKAAWGALLHGCRVHGEVELGKRVGRRLLDMDKSDSGVYVLLSSLCAGGGEWEGVKRTRTMMREGGVRKTPGRSSIEVDGEVHAFFAAGKSHDLSGPIYGVLNLVYADLGLEV